MRYLRQCRGGDALFLFLWQECRTNKKVFRTWPVYAQLEDRVGRPIFDSTGAQSGTVYDIGAMPTQPLYQFVSLFDVTTRTLQHYAELLRQLRSVPRFGG